MHPNQFHAITDDYIHRKKHLQLTIGIIHQGEASYFQHRRVPRGSTISGSDMLYEIGSITKVFTSILLQACAEDGYVSLDKPISEYLEPLHNSPYWNKITLQHLATHTSGLPRMAGNMKPRNRLNPFADYTEELMLAYLTGYHGENKIGSYEYSNLGFGLLGHILCRTAGSTYDELLHRYITGPLHMPNTSVHLSKEQKQRLATGFTSTGKRVPHWDLSLHEGAGGIKSSAEDMITFIQSNLHAQQNPSIPRYLQTIHSPVSMNGTDRHLGWVLEKQPGYEYLWHNGGTYGFSSYTAFDSHNDTGVIVLSNYCYTSAFILDILVGQLLSKWRKPGPMMPLDEIGRQVMNVLRAEANV
ncbi:beta-lactamase family protein [Paenibacillus sp. PR3]|uniref:Beta-lactamase family protein n=1 Tax=Paenibacillus terricola TaxID=2763503 RepID=A0ABR8N1R4_9BACL|nr:serine hydrolase domain-containing protein [Paenibacillus terricola]MBD3922115.1 beta-lactamase family protein [Paenibacillus terricola]